ncbi:iron ABC transporter permease [Limnohabitans sp. Bal53]|uniref:FecCD family ABC transporter permease n=1 Tax=Limnohabitans sp. Bal53 TaxID=1977910 RepID=UPI000D36483C|nr:iron ABC transporter permease [Limnohabitans sp. Bal53]PUE41830.1 ABC transporter permease [Limnohabitans sp. Bal53]
MNTHTQAPRWALLLLAVGLAVVVLGTAAGSQGWQAWWSAQTDAVSRQIVWDIRLPRSLGAWLGGALLGLAGAVAQGLFRNPLADPYLLGSASGASLGVGVYLSLWGGSSWVMNSWLGLGLTGAAFVGAVLAVVLTLLLARGVQQTLRLLLAGVVVGVVLGALTSLISLMQPQVLQAMQGFMLGSTAFVSWIACATMAAVLALCMALAWVFARVLDALSLGEATAQSLGVPLPLARMVLVGVISLATGAAVAHIGLVAFVGLAAPHLVRSLVRCTHAWRLFLSALMGGALLVLADVVARVLLAPQELPVGVLTAVLGGVYLLWRVYRDAGTGARS